MKIILLRIILVLIFPVIDWLSLFFLKRRFAELNQKKFFKFFYWAYSALLLLVALIFTVNRNYTFRDQYWELFEIDVVLLTFNYLIKFLYVLTEFIFILIELIFKNLKRVIIWKRIKDIFNIVVIICAVFIILKGIFIGRYNFQIKKYELKYSNLPEGFDNYKIVHISDLHLGSFRNSKEKISDIVKLINSLSPDLIVFTGDLVNNVSSESYGFDNILKELKAKDGVFAVTGNHDYGTYVSWDNSTQEDNNFSELVDFYKRINITLLLNDNFCITKGSNRIIISGIESSGKPPFDERGDIDKSLAGVNDNDFVILLSHDPSYWKAKVLNYKNIMLTLSGHTHSLQIACCNNKYSPSAWLYDEWYGLYESREQKLIVSNGLGYILMPFRIGANPEVGLIMLKRQ